MGAHAETVRRHEQELFARVSPVQVSLPMLLLWFVTVSRNVSYRGVWKWCTVPWLAVGTVDSRGYRYLAATLGKSFIVDVIVVGVGVKKQLDSSVFAVTHPPRPSHVQ